MHGPRRHLVSNEASRHKQRDKDSNQEHKSKFAQC